MRRWKWLGGIVIGLAVLWWGVTSSPALRWILSSRFRAATGAVLSEGNISISLSGRVSVSDAVVRSPGIDGAAGELLRFDRLDAVVSWRRLLGMVHDGKPAVDQVMLYRPRVRLSQNSADGTLNASVLKFPKGSGGGVTLPLVQIDDGVIELGEHAGNGARDPYTMLKHIDLHGRITPSKGAADGSVEIVLTPDRPTPADPTIPAVPVTIAGVVQGQDLSLSVSGLSLKDWPASAMPSRIRTLAEMLDVQGSIGKTTFSYSPASAGGRAGIKATAELIDVALNLPVTEDAEIAATGASSLLRMSHVNGSIELADSGVNAALVGSIEEVPYRVSLRYDGTDRDSPFTCEVLTENFKMDKGLRILRFVPPLVRERLADFSWPTGLVTSNVTISRGAPVDGKAAELSVTGEMSVKEAVSAFKRFPYEFRDISGKVRFSDTRIDLEDIRGVSPAGAVVHATGFIEPPTGDAHCVIDVHVDNMPVDADVIKALNARRKGVPPIIFNQDHYSRMLAAGLIAAPGDAQADPSVPRFGLGGLAKVHTTVTRPPGPDTEWLEKTDIDFASITILPEWFPLPMIATNVEVRIKEDNTMTVKGGEYRPITGGSATADANVDYLLIVDPDREGSPEITVSAKDVPTGRLLNYAVGAAIDRANRNKAGGSPGPRLRGILDDFNAVGLVSGELRLFNDDKGSGRVTADIAVGPSLLTPMPDAVPGAAPDEKQVELANVAGTVRIIDREVLFDVTGTPRDRAAGAIPLAESTPVESPASVHVVGRSGPDASGGESEFTTTVEAKQIDLSSPIHQVIGVFSPAAAARFHALAKEYAPAGRVSGIVDVKPAADGSATTVRIDTFDTLAIGVAGKQTEFDEVDGSVEVGPDGAVTFRSLTAALHAGDQPLGRMLVQGTLKPGAGEGDESLAEPAEDFKIALERARAEAPILRTLAARRLSEQSAKTLEEMNPRGEFDATLEVRPGSGAGGSPGLVGTIKPRSLTLFMHGMDVPFDTMSGEVSFNSQGGKIVALEGRSEDYNLRADGSWARTPEDDVKIDLIMNGGSNGMPPALLAMLPETVHGVLTSVEFGVTGLLELGVMDLRMTESDSPSRQRLQASGKVHLAGGQMTLGLPITECDGDLEFRVENNDFSTPAGFGIDTKLTRFRLSGLQMERGMVHVQGKPETGEIIVRELTADCYGGKFTGNALVGRPGTGPREFNAEFSLAGVRFAPTLRDLTGTVGRALDEKPVEDSDATRGLIDAQLSIGGQIDKPGTRRGRGSANIAGPSVLRMPLVMPLIRFSNFQLPTDEALDLAHASFYIDGPVMAFEDLSVFSKNVHILGFGTMTWPDLALDLRFNSKAIKRIPVLNWLLEGIRDELVTTSVTGTLGKPDVSSVPFESTRKFFVKVFGSGMNASDKRMLELGKQAEKTTTVR